MIIDFKEIPEANKGGGKQDTFELLSRDFLSELGLEIIRNPDRGPDGKKDMVVREIRKGILGDTTIDWLVSCKHFAHSKKSRAVNDTDEPNITERLAMNHCQGFMGFYSTIAASSLSNMLFGCKEKFEHQIFDGQRIERIISQDTQGHLLFKRYFTASYEKHKHLLAERQSVQGVIANLTEDDHVRLHLTSQIILEVGKIEEKYFGADWEARAEILFELYKFSAHTNIKIAERVFSFFIHVVEQTRNDMPRNIASTIFSLLLDFFPYANDERQQQIIELGNDCAIIAFNMIYDAFIYLNNFYIAMYGLTILKYVYKKGKQGELHSLVKKVNATYQEIEKHLQRPERNDLGNALELVAVFKADRDVVNLAFPYLPDHLLNCL